MVKYITPDRIVNAILMDRTFLGTYLIVEGNNDKLFFLKFIDQNSCTIRVAFGKPKVIEVVNKLLNNNYQRILGIIDLDFDTLENVNNETNFILATDYHDIEMMVINSPVIDLIRNVYAEDNKFLQFIKSKNKSFLDILLELAAPIGYLKWVNKVNEIGLLFKPDKPKGNPIKYQNFIDKRSLVYLGDDSLITHIKNYSVRPEIVNADIIALMAAKQSSSINLLHLCNGHDITNIISLSLMKAISSNDSNAIKFDQLEKDLILAYDSRDFVKTSLYDKIKKWEVANSPQKILSL